MSKKCVFYSGFADERYLHWEWLKSIWHHSWATRWWFWGSVALLVKLSNFSDQELSNSYSFSRNDPTISSALFVSSIPPNCWAQSFPDQILSYKEKLTFRLVGKIIFRTRAIWVGIFWHGTQGSKKWSGKRRKHLTPNHFYQTLSFSQLYMVVCIFEKIPGGHCNWKSAVHKRPLFASLVISCFDTVFENHRKSLIQHCERSELTFDTKNH